MKEHWLNPDHPLFQQKAKKPSTEFRSKMDAQVAARIEQDKKDREVKQSSWLLTWAKKFRGVGVWVAFCAFALFLWSQLITSPMWLPWSDAPADIVAETGESNISRKQFKSSIAAQLEQKKIAASHTPTLLAYTPNAVTSKKFERKVGLKRKG